MEPAIRSLHHILKCEISLKNVYNRGTLGIEEFDGRKKRQCLRELLFMIDIKTV